MSWPPHLLVRGHYLRDESIGLEVVTAVQLRREIDGELWLGLGGLMTIAFGVFLLARPEMGALAVVWIIACYAVGFGAIQIVEAFEARALFRNIARA